jgi:uncharacterized membrane protein
MKKSKNLELLIKHLNLKVTDESINDFFENHPSYPSMASISDAFNFWKIPNAAVAILPEQLKEVNLPSIAYMEENNTDQYYVLIEKIDEDKIEYYDSEKGNIVSTLEEFSEKWRGILLLFEPNDNSEQPEYELAKKENSQRAFEFNIQIFTALSLVVISIYGLISGEFIIIKIHQSLNLVGLGLSIALLLIEYSNNTDITKKLCDVKETVSCEDIVKSKDAKLFGWIGYAEIGLIYFGAFSLMSIFNYVNQDLYFVNLFISLIALTFIPFSIYYQAKVAKKWCTLCLYVQFILFSQGLLSFFQFQNNNWITPLSKDIIINIISFSIIASMWFFIKKYLLENIKLRKEVKLLSRLRFEPSFFINWLKNKPLIDFKQTEKEIIFGNKESKNILLLILNPLCGSCYDTLKSGFSLLKTYPDDIKMIVRMIGETEHHYLVITHLLDSYNDPNLEEMLLFNFKNRDYDTFMRNYEKEQTQRTHETLRLHEQWANENHLTKTPVVFFNNVKIETPFDIEDLPYYIPALLED